MANKIQLRRGTKAQLATLGALSVAEPGYCTDTKELFIGNASGGNTPLVTATSADITYYVRTDGSDNNTGLANTAGGAFKTIGKALSMIPQIVNHTVAINVAAGTYAESPKLSGFNGSGYVGIYGTGVVNVASMIIERCQRIQVFGISFTSTTTDAVSTYDGGFIEFRNCVFTVASSFNAISSYSQTAKIESCTFSNRNTAIQVNGGQCYIVECLGTNNTAAVLPAEGTIVKTAGTIHSGIIHTGFNGIVNPWGDNTKSTRPIGEMHHGNNATNQVIPASTWTKVLFTGVINNNKAIANVANSRFVIPEPGMYSLFARVGLFGTASSLTRELIAVYVDGIFNGTLAEQSHGSKPDILISGNALLDLYGGQTVELYAYSDVSCSINTSDTATHFALIRIA